MTRAKWRDIKQTYRDCVWVTRISDRIVQNQFIGEFETNKDFVLFIENEAGQNADDIAETIEREQFDADGNWTLLYSDMAHGVFVQDGYYFYREPEE